MSSPDRSPQWDRVERAPAARLTLRYDIRAPDFGPPAEHLYRAALDQSEWADGAGFHNVAISEHHASPDGFLPSPVVMAAAIGARTHRVRISISLLLLPFYEPIRLAEDLAVADLVSSGRIDVMIGAGYREEEFDMYGVDIHRRGALMEDGVSFLTRAWTGEPFEYRGRMVQVLPRPAQRPRPRIVLGGASPASARRAARLADGYAPMGQRLYEIYVEELARLGKPVPSDGPARRGPQTPVVAVTEDPERTWKAIERNLMHDALVYGSWTSGRRGAIFTPVSTFEELRTAEQYWVLTPEECLDKIREFGALTLHPLVGGIDPQLAAESLQLFADRVMPHVALEETPTARPKGRE